MFEVVWQGRGGQGIVTASEILALSVLKEGKYFQSFPDFGPERMGAPIKAYTRIDDRPINIHSQIYEPDVVVVLDDSLLDSVNVVSGLNNKGILIVNTIKTKVEIRNKTKFEGKIFIVDANKIAIETIGRPIANICTVGSLSKVSGIINLENIIETIKDVFGKKFSEKVIEGNVASAKRGYDEVK
jgi:pyruvate ferredoxin oxidoreductase gamma subunit